MGRAVFRLEVRVIGRTFLKELMGALFTTEFELFDYTGNGKNGERLNCSVLINFYFFAQSVN